MLLQLILIFTLAIALAVPLSRYIDYVLSGRMGYNNKTIRTFENTIFKICAIEPYQHNCKTYLFSLLSLSSFSLVIAVLILKFQHYLPLNPFELKGLDWSLAINIATSYITATNWQAYSGEITLSYFSQCTLTMIAFISTGIGISAAIAVIRGIANENLENEGFVFGNFWCDLLRTIIFILIPICIIISLVFISQGVIQNFQVYTKIITLDNLVQTIPQGPVATQESIKFLGVNGGGYFGTNSAHPYENPTGLSNFLQMLLMILIPCTLALTYANAVGKPKHGWITIVFMTLLLFFSSYLILNSEVKSTIGQTINLNTEGKETRFGIPTSAVYTAFCATTSGAANSMLMSFNPESVIYAIASMLFGGAIFGGAGAGLLNLLLFIIMSVFLAGMMSGRTPKYLGKTIEFQEIKYITIFLVIYQCLIVTLLSASILNSSLIDDISTRSSLAITQLAIATGSTMVNNGLGYGSLPTDNIYLNISLTFSMIVGRISLMYCMFKVAESLATKPAIHNRLEEVQTDHWFFAFLIFFAMLNDFLVFVPTLIIGPTIEFLISR